MKLEETFKNKENIKDLNLNKNDIIKLLELLNENSRNLNKEYEDEYDPFLLASIEDEYKKITVLYLKLEELYKNM